MEVTYKNKQLQRYAEDETYSVRKLGPVRSEKYLQRIGDLMDANTLEDVRNLPGNYMNCLLTGKGNGQFLLMDLTD